MGNTRRGRYNAQSVALTQARSLSFIFSHRRQSTWHSLAGSSWYQWSALNQGQKDSFHFTFYLGQTALQQLRQFNWVHLSFFFFFFPSFLLLFLLLFLFNLPSLWCLAFLWFLWPKIRTWQLQSLLFIMLLPKTSPSWPLDQCSSFLSLPPFCHLHLCVTSVFVEALVLHKEQNVSITPCYI